MTNIDTNLGLLKAILKQHIANDDVQRAINELKRVITAQSDRYDDLIAIQKRHHEAISERLQGLHTDEELGVIERRFHSDVLLFINSLEETDLLNSLYPVPEKQGQLLYRIPDSMQVKTEVRCIVRIAKGEMPVKERIGIDEHIKEERINASDTMMVELIDPGAEPSFTVRRINDEAIQIVRSDDFTEWLFYVTPLTEGRHTLALKVSLIEYIDGNPYKRDKILEREVDVTTATGQGVGEDQLAFRSAGSAFTYYTATEQGLTFKYIQALLFAIALGDRSSYLKSLSANEKRDIDTIISPSKALGEEPVKVESAMSGESKRTDSFSGGYSSFTDMRDGKTYRTLVIGGLRWMVDNLNYDVGAGCWYYDNNPLNGIRYGRLYTWQAAKRACPRGWRLPTEEEWREMAKLYGGCNQDAEDDGKAAYRALIEGGNSGFSALLGGSHGSNDGFYYLGKNGFYWSSTEFGSDCAFGFYLSSDSGELRRNAKLKMLGQSCRFVQDLSI